MSAPATIALARVTAAAPDPGDARVSTAFVTRQGVRHDGRRGGYRNEVLSVRVGAAVGSCAVDPGSLSGPAGDAVLDRVVGGTVADLLADADPAVRTAVLDAHLADQRALGDHDGGLAVDLPSGSSVAKSTARAAAVAELLPLRRGRVLVVGVVNSLLAALRERGLDPVPCDRLGGTTEWGEPVRTGYGDDWDAALVTGMTLPDGGFDDLAATAAGRPLVVFAQTGAAVFRTLVADGSVTALSAEPYPFFWLDGGPTRLHVYRGWTS